MSLFLLLAEVRRFKEFLQDCQSGPALQVSHSSSLSVARWLWPTDSSMMSAPSFAHCLTKSSALFWRTIRTLSQATRR